jgi:hypothetical protein
MVVQSDEYKKKLEEIEKGKKKYKIMEFFMNGVKMAMPYAGQKVTSGYLKKETQSKGLMFKHSWQLKYCILDLSKFEFKYAKNPTETFTNILMS